MLNNLILALGLFFFVHSSAFILDERFIISKEVTKGFFSDYPNKGSESLLLIILPDLNDVMSQFAQGIEVLMRYYDNKFGVWFDPNCIKKGSCENGVGWWYWGNAAHVLADYEYYRSSGNDYLWAFENIFSQNKGEMTNASYFDDEGWWGLAMIHMFKATNNPIYLNQAKLIADDMKDRGHQDVCGQGGIFWDSAHTQVGAIANELFISLCAQISLLDDPLGKYKQQALDGWDWLQSSGLVGNDHIILDHYNVDNETICGELIPWTFTYTNGVILSGLTDLYKLTLNISYLDIANSIANAAISEFALNGIISDKYSGDPSSLAEDGFLFKGIFVNNLAYLASNTNDNRLKEQIITLLTNNYNMLVSNQKIGNTYGYLWNQSLSYDNPADVVTHLSALYLLDSVVQLSLTL